MPKFMLYYLGTCNLRLLLKQINVGGNGHSQGWMGKSFIRELIGILIMCYSYSITIISNHFTLGLNMQ